MSHHHQEDNGSFGSKLVEVAKGDLMDAALGQGFNAAESALPSASGAIEAAASCDGFISTGLAVVDAVQLLARIGKMFAGKPLTYDQENELLAVQSGKNQVSIHCTRNLHFVPNVTQINAQRPIVIKYNELGNGVVPQPRREHSFELSHTR